MKFYTLFNSVRLKRGGLLKTILVMKLIILLITVVCFHVAAAGYAQKITLNEKNVSMETVFKDIRKQSGYIIFFDKSLLNNLVPVNIKVTNASLQETLNICLEDQPLTFTIVDNTVIIKQKETTFLDNLKEKTVKLFAIPSDINGTVVDSVGKPLVGASITIKGTAFNTITDNNGDFHFSKVPQGKYTLVASYIGFVKQERILEVIGKDIYTKFSLYGSLSALDQIQVIGYGAESKRFSVGSVSTITAEDIERQPVTNPLLALEGQAPGLAINATSGVPGSNVLVQVRGQNTLATTSNGIKPYTQPLFIIDGVPFAPQNNNVSQLSNLANVQSFSGGVNQQGGVSPFNNINPNDIESISILKDADATSIYGTQGSNGVIIITTKKGKPGKTTFNLNVNTGFNSDAYPVKLMNTQQYIQLRNDAFAADGLIPSNNPSSSGYAPDLTIFDQNKYTDWQKVIFGKTSNNTDVHASVSGGTANNTFIVSAGYSRSDYNFPGDFSDQRLTLHSALHTTSTDKRFTLDLVTDYGYDQNNSSVLGGSKNILLAPNLPNLLDPAGNLVWGYQGVDISGYQFYSYLKQPSNLQNYNLNTSLHLSYKILQGLTIGADLGYSRNTTAEQSQFPAAAQTPLFQSITATFASGANQAINIEPQINYTKSIGKGVLSALLGSTYKKNTGYSTLTKGLGYSNDNFLGSINGAATIQASDNSTIYKYSAAFARLKYIYDQKYIIDFTGRRDGSSNFGPTHQFGNFGSVGAGWIFSEEKAFKQALPFFSYGKLSGSYGTTGSDGSQAYYYQALYSPINFPAFQGIKQSAPTNLYNPDYSWALKKSLNVALDFGFFNNRLLLNATYYRDREGDQLVNYPLPVQTGFVNVLGNLDAEIQNSGFEFTANSTNIKIKNFSWTTNFNISFNRNKLLSFPNLSSSSYNNKYIIGQPTSIVFGYQYKDVNPTTGLFEFYDKNGGVTSNPLGGIASTGGDQVPIANREVNYMGGFGNSFTYKRFNLYVFCQFSSQNAPNYLATAYGGTNRPGFIGNQPLALLDNYWKNPGDQSELQRLATGFSSKSLTALQDFALSSGAYGNDTYLRLKTVALSYSLPAALLKKINIQGGKIYVNAQNLLTVTNYKVGDPEQFTYTSFPLQRVIAFGLNLNF